VERTLLSAALGFDFNFVQKAKNAEASVFINPSTLLWTKDKRLRKAAEKFGIHAGLA
jgi:hypothetical protein